MVSSKKAISRGEKPRCSPRRGLLLEVGLVDPHPWPLAVDELDSARRNTTAAAVIMSVSVIAMKASGCAEVSLSR